MATYSPVSVLYQSKRTLIYKAIRNSDGRKVILKALRNEIPSEREVLALERDYQITSKLMAAVPKAVVTVLGKSQVSGRQCLVFEDDDASSLNNVLHRKKVLSLDEFFDYAIQMSYLLSLIHQQMVIHKDFKLDNVLLTSCGKLRLIDFGTASVVSLKQPSLPPTMQLEGTLLYVSPEMTGRTSNCIDFRTDLYSLGVSLYVLFTSRFPFDSEDPMEIVHAHLAKKPKPVSSLRKSCPRVLSMIIDKLLTKNPEDRYQSALGVMYDLEACYKQYKHNAHFGSEFVLGSHDIVNTLQISSKLYGRTNELQQLDLELEDVQATHKPSLVLVKGASGCGKTALVEEFKMRTSCQEKRPKFIAGKFDQFKRSQPYSAVIEALRSLVNQILIECPEYIMETKESLITALEGHGFRLIPLLPEIQVIIGEHEGTDANVMESQEQFGDAFTKLFSAFTQKNSVIMFLDDLQWGDNASLQLLEKLLVVNHASLLIIGTYRDNEVGVSHPLLMTLQHIRCVRHCKLVDIELKLLGEKDVNEMIADSLQLPSADTKELTALIHVKCGGNPFFIKEYLARLYQDNVIFFDSLRHKWSWKLDELRNAKYSENVAEMMIKSIKSLPQGSLALLQFASCLGNTFSLDLIKTCYPCAAEQIDKDLFDIVSSGWLIEQRKDDKVIYTFAHDRIQAVAYTMTPESKRAQYHLNIGLAMLSRIPPEEREDLQLTERLFELATHLNNAKSILTEQHYEDALKVNSAAAQKAFATFAFEHATIYAKTVLRMIEALNLQQPNYDELFKCKLICAQSTQICGDLAESRKHFEDLKTIAKTRAEKTQVSIYFLRMLCTNGDFNEGVLQAIRTLELYGYEDLQLLDLKNESEQFAYAARIKQKTDSLLGQNYDILQSLKTCEDEDYALLVQLVAEAVPLIFNDFTTSKFVLLTCQGIGVTVTLQHGLSPYCGLCFNLYGWCMAGFFGERKQCYRLGEASMKMFMDKFSSNISAKTMVLHSYLHTNLWGGSLFDSMDVADQAIIAGLNSGNLIWASYTALFNTFHMIYCGIPCEKALKLQDMYIEFLKKAKNEVTGRVFWNAFERYFKFFEGQTIAPDTFALEYGEEGYRLATERDNPHNRAIFFICKATAMYFAGNVEKMIYFMKRANQDLAGVINFALYYFWSFFSCLILAVAVENNEGAQRQEYLVQFEKHLSLLREYSEANDQGFGCQYLLAEAEFNRVTNAVPRIRLLKLYDQAITKAKTHKFDNVAGLANEIAGKISMEEELNEKLVSLYITEAKNYYTKCNMYLKVRDLYFRFPKYLASEDAASISLTPDSPLQSTSNRLVSISTGQEECKVSSFPVDVVSIIKMTQQLSSNIEIDQLLEEVLRLIVKNSGADLGYLLLKDVESSGFNIRLKQRSNCPVSTLNIAISDAERDYPVSIFSSVIQSKKQMAIENASRHAEFMNDPYVSRNLVKSILCVPIVHKGNMTGLIHLENNSVAGAFTASRLQIVNILIAQIAISVDNALLYSKLKKLNRSYKRFLPQQFLDQLQKGKVTEIKLGDCVQKEMTIMFSDIRNFSNLSEEMSPEENFSFINSYLSRIGPIVRECGGFIDKFIDDAIMALFPRSGQDAVKAALLIHERLKEYNSELERQGKNVKIGIGMNTGKVMLGTIGEQLRLEGTVISDAVNCASRLEGLTKAFDAEILASESTVNFLLGNSEFDYRFIGKFRVKGKNVPILIYQVFTDDLLPTQIREDFNLGLQQFAKGDFASALVSFEKIKEWDKAARYYVPLCKYLSVNTPSLWDGELQLDKEGNPLLLGPRHI